MYIKKHEQSRSNSLFAFIKINYFSAIVTINGKEYMSDLVILTVDARKEKSKKKLQ